MDFKLTNKPTAKTTMLRQIPAFRSCSEQQLRDISSFVDEVSVSAGFELTIEGTSARQTFVIVEGWAAVVIGGAPVAALGPGEFVGEMAMLDRGLRTATVVAKTPMELLVVGPQAFDRFAKHPVVADRISKALVERLRQADLAHHRP